MKSFQKQSSIVSWYIVIALLTLPLVFSGCSSGTASTTSAVTSGADTGAASESAVTCDATKGGQLYDSKGCAGCHSSLAASTKTGATYQRIKDGITNNPGTMGQYSTLTDDEIYDIAFALGDTKGCEKPSGASGSGSGNTGGTSSSGTADSGSADSGSTGSVGAIGGPINSLDPGTVINLLDNQADITLFNLDAGGVTGTYISYGGKLLNTADPTVAPLMNLLLTSGRTVTRMAMPTTTEAGALVSMPANLILEDVTLPLATSIVAAVNGVTGGQVKALLPMPLDPTRTCEDCHHSKINLILAMTDVVNNLKYPGLAADVSFVDNFYVSSDYTTLPDSMMSKAAKHAKWEGCVTCHSKGDSFDPFPSDNWVPRSNPNDGPEVAKAFGSTNDTSKTCGKCHAVNASMFNKGIMGTHRGHLFGFNYNDVEIEGTNTESNFFYDPLGPSQSGTDLNRLPLDRNGKRMHAGYYQSRSSCSTCHQSCSDCHLTGPGNSPIGTLGAADILKDVQGVEIINVDQTHYTEAVRVKAYEGSALRRGGVSLMEMRKGYKAGLSRGLPYSIYETGMDVMTHKIHRPTTAEQGNTLAPQNQKQSIEFCWRCHFRTGAEFMGNWINVVPNVNYSKSSLGHLQAGMTCTDCHKWADMHGQTSKDTQSFAGTSSAPDNPSHPGGNPVGSTPAWDTTPNPNKTTCGLCHVPAGKALGATGGLSYGNLVTPKYQTIAKPVKGLATMPVPGKVSKMSHKNVKCEACHTQAQQNCWNCHLEKSEEVTGLPYMGTNDFSIDALYPIMNVREAEGEPALTAEENALLKEAPAENDLATLSLALTFPNSPNTVNKSVRYLARNNKGQVGSVVHCPGPMKGTNNPTNSSQPLNLDGGLYMTKFGAYGQTGAIGDVTTSAEGSWYMEPGHSTARTPDGGGFTGCYNCHADTVRLGQEPITNYRKNPWVMKGIGAPEAVMPSSHSDGRIKDANGAFNCNCHSSDGLVHNGTFEGPWPLDALPEDGEVAPPPAGADGAALYASKCAACHGQLATSLKKGVTYTRIKAGLLLPVMQSISLTDEQIHAIAKALGGE